MSERNEITRTCGSGEDENKTGKKFGQSRAAVAMIAAASTVNLEARQTMMFCWFFQTDDNRFGNS